MLLPPAGKWLNQLWRRENRHGSAVEGGELLRHTGQEGRVSVRPREGSQTKPKPKPNPNPNPNPAWYLPYDFIIKVYKYKLSYYVRERICGWPSGGRRRKLTNLGDGGYVHFIDCDGIADMCMLKYIMLYILSTFRL